jgi:short-subunit dehydrogenase
MVLLWLKQTHGRPAGVEINGKVALITGASEGVGAACAEAFRRRGARLSLAARSASRLEEVGRGEALVTPGDLTDADVRRRVVERTLERYGRVDILINNAGVGLYVAASQAPLDAVRRMFELNVFAALELAQLAAPGMKERRSGAIAMVSSIAGRMTLPWLSLYSASKAALDSVADALRVELKPHGIQVTTVAPGYVTTGFQSHVLGGRPPAGLARYQRFAISAQQCAEAIARGVERNARTVMAPRSGWIAVMAARLFPSFTDRQLARINRNLEQGE